MPRNRRQTGAAMVEALIAMGILAIGTTGVVSLITQVYQTGTRSALHTASLNLFATFVAEARVASCDVEPPGLLFNPALADDGLDLGMHTVAAASSSIRTVGDFTGANAFPGAPPLRLSYNVTVEPGTADAPPSLRLDVEVREIRSNPAENSVTSGYWIKRFTASKMCSARQDRRADCGGTPPCGRGEYY